MTRIPLRTLSSGSVSSVRRGIKCVFRKHIRVLAIAVVVSLLVASLPVSASSTKNMRTRAQQQRSLPAQIYGSVSAAVTSIGSWMASFIATEPTGNGSTYQPVAAYITPAPPFIDAPTNLTVTAASSTSINLNWTAPSGTIDHYVVERSQNIQGPFFFLANVTGATTKNDTTVTNLNAYLYRVRAVSNTGAVSPPSNMALGTAISFQFQELDGQEIRAQHFHDVRAAINAVRPLGNLPAESWDRANVAGLVVEANDLNEMRTALDAALTALAIPVTSYEDQTLTVGVTLIKAAHIEQLQTRSTRGSSNSSGPIDSDSSTARLDPLNATGGGGENPLSRNFNWNLPLLSLPGRSGLNLGLTLSYNSLVWTKIGANAISFDDDNGFPGPGFRLGFPAIQQRYFNSEVGKQAYLLISPDGSRTELRQVGSSNFYEAADSSHALLDENTMILRTTAGTQMSYVLHGGEFKCTQIKNRNGNFITISYTAAGQINTVTDTLNRVITFNYINGWLDKITQVWKQGSPNQVTHNWARFEYADKTIDTNFPGLTVFGPADSTSIKTLTKVTLTDDSRFEFSYTSWGQVWKVTHFAADNSVLNYRTYDLPQTGTDAHTDCPRFTVRKDWAKYWNGDTDGTTSASEEVSGATFIVPVSDSWTMPDNTAASGVRAQVTTSDGTLNKIYFVGTAGTDSGWKRGLAALIETHSGGTWKRKVMTTWTQDDETNPFILNPRVKETNVYDPEGNRARTEIDYGASFSLGNGMSCHLPRVVFEYATNATTKLRSTRTTYNMTTTYTSRRILGLVSVRELFEGDVTGTLKAKSELFYDNENGSISIQGTDAPVQHDNINYSASFVTGRANLSSVKRHNVENGQSTTSSIKYNTAGAVVSTKDASNHEATISYADSFSDGNNSRNTLAYPTKVTDADTFESTTKYDFDFGAVTSNRTPKPNEITNVPENQRPERVFTFDTIGRLERITNSVNSGLTRFEYPNTNRVDTFTTIEVGQGEGHSFRITDGVGRVVATASDHPGSTGGFSGQQIVYDNMGRLFKTSNPTETSASGHPSQWSAVGDDQTAGWLYTQQTYDWKGRPLRTTHPDATYKEAEYSGCGCAGGEVVTLTDEGTVINFAGTIKKRQEKIYSDVLGRVVKVELLNWDGTGPNGTGPNNTPYSTTVTTHNVRDQVTQVRQYAGADTSGTFMDTTMDYDGYGRLESHHIPEQNAGTATSYSYNADDTINTVTDPRGVITTHSYNNRHLVAGISYTAPGGIASTATATFGYDAAGNRTSMTDGFGSKSYGYDQLSRLISETRTLTGVGTFTLTYDYNLANQLKKITDPWNATINYGYDVVGKLTEVTGSGTLVAGVTSYASGLQYRAWGGLKQISVSTLNSSFGYNSRLQTTNFNISGVVNENYSYFNDGRLSFVDNTTDSNWDRAIFYDHVGRITFAGAGGEARQDTGPAPFRETFSYNAFSDSTHRVNETWDGGFYSFSGSYTNHRRTGWNYDANGRVTTIDTRTYTYDAAGRTINLTGQRWTPNGFVPTSNESGYDGDGNRVRENAVNNGFSTITYYLRSSALGAVVAELNGSGVKQIGHVYTPSGVELATQVVGQNFVQFKQRSPLNTTERGVSTTGSTSRKEFDPVGALARLSQNSPPDHGGDAGEIPSGGSGSLDSRFNSISNPGAGCQLDGVFVPCDWIGRFANSIEVEFSRVFRNRRDGRHPVREPAEPVGVGLFRVFVPNGDGDGGQYELISLQQFKPGERWLTRDEIKSLTDKMLKFLDEHPECERYTNELLKELGAATGFYAGTIREIVNQFSRTGEIITDGSVMTTGGGSSHYGRFGFPVIGLTYGTTDDNTTVSLMHEMLHWAGQVGSVLTGQFSNHYTDEALATAWHKLGVVMSVEEYRRTYPKHSQAMKTLTGTPSDFAASTLSGNAQFVACMNQWDSGFTPKHVDKPKP